jgi:hypothetical protein
MSASLIPALSSQKADAPLSRDQQAYTEQVARIKSTDAMLAGINRGAEQSHATGTRSSSGIQHILLIDDAPPQREEAKKAAPLDLHPKVKPLVSNLTADASALLSLVVKADEAYRGATFIDLSSFAVKSAMGISEVEAVAARDELERRGFIVFHDDGSGNRGFYPRLT